MRKVVRDIAVLIGMLLVVGGLVVCMCETPDWDKQVLNMVCGLGSMVLGAIICCSCNEGSECFD